MQKNQKFSFYLKELCTKYVIPMDKATDIETLDIGAKSIELEQMIQEYVKIRLYNQQEVFF